MITYIQKRSGDIELFDKKVIAGAIQKAFDESGEGNDVLSKKVTESVVDILERKTMGGMPTVEEVQDVVEDMLISYNFSKSAKAYIKYRFERQKARMLV